MKKIRIILAALIAAIAIPTTISVATADSASAMTAKVDKVYNGSGVSIWIKDYPYYNVRNLAPRGYSPSTMDVAGYEIPYGYCGTAQVGTNRPFKIKPGVWYWTDNTNRTTYVIAYKSATC